MLDAMALVLRLCLLAEAHFGPNRYTIEVGLNGLCAMLPWCDPDTLVGTLI